MATTFENLYKIEKINTDEVRLLWCLGFWDGPIDGLCLYHNNKYWFEMVPEGEDDLPSLDQRHFLIVELSPQQVVAEETWHELFRQKVGTHCDYGEPHPAVKPTELHREFYDPYRHRAKPDYSKNPVIGWFEMG